MVQDTRILHTPILDTEDTLVSMEGILDTETIMVMGIQAMVLIMEDMLIPPDTTQG